MDKKILDLTAKINSIETILLEISEKINTIELLILDKYKPKMPITFSANCNFYDTSFVLFCLKQHSLNGDIMLLKKIFIDDITDSSLYPIKIINGKIKYWMNNKYNDELNTYVRDVLYNTLFTLYTMVNTACILDNMDDIFPHNHYITSLDTPANKTSIYKKFITYLYNETI